MRKYLRPEPLPMSSVCLDLAKERGAKALAKSKSLTTEEIELNQPLIDAGIDVVETDLGEQITKKQWGSICNSKTNPEYFDFRKLYRRPARRKE